MEQRTIKGKVYVPCVLHVVASDSDGPRLFKLVRFDERVHLKEGDAFWIVYAPEEMARRLS
jgi:hypothetical protein